MSVLLPAFRRVRLTQQCVIHPQDKGGNYLPCASEDWAVSYTHLTLPTNREV